MDTAGIAITAAGMMGTTVVGTRVPGTGMADPAAMVHAVWARV